jgi:cytochrome c peroxidase
LPAAADSSSSTPGVDSAASVGTSVTPAKVRLGRWLFFDKRLSADGSKSCASCHRPDHAFTDGDRVSTGVYGRKGRRRSQPLLDVVEGGPFFWDGRATTLVDQAKGPLQDPSEMGNDPARLASRIGRIAGYRAPFEESFGDGRVDMHRIAEALAAYQATLTSKRPSLGSLGAAAQRGLEVFLHRGGCGGCHRPSEGFADRRFHNLGIGWDPKRSSFADRGRFEVTRADGDTGAFKTPMLFDLARRAPYMHDGSLRTLQDVIDFYDGGGNPNPWLDSRIAPLGLSEAEKADLLVFLQSLESGDAVDPGPSQFPQ